ncbi:protein-methionine-sulfoxide reductase heme-binding subunit MsrQ [Thalassovita sp.]|uniref:protein-methionine-sulfoxide reductase heme-binding subunit MsrQ n=1 Tax=Thalassovita sp. TaxID=1979401 RepID=UPI002882BEBC|nr:protein-methionine-sulfoxide reductase heme-binding subunit MsrQ [Thalassovita sp.]MDF1802244.1 protein-methionine-sulfoxide reductase heme-binding subunit MsrQ [Thalassovita sp.]
MNRLNQLVRGVPPWLLYIGVAIWTAFLFWQGVTGRLGPDPVKALEHGYGEAALIFLVAGLAVSPLRRTVGLNLIRFRRAIGLSAFFFLLCHLLVWAALDVQTVARVWADIVKRPYITVGMVSFVLLVPLAVTSNNWSVRRLGARWRSLHRLTYVAVILGGVHFVMLRKGIQIEPIMYLMGIALLLGLRLPSRRKTS